MLFYTTVFEGNNGELATTNAVKMTPRNKHIGVKYHFSKAPLCRRKRNHTLQGRNSSEKAYIFTKAMAPEKFVMMRKLVCKW